MASDKQAYNRALNNWKGMHLSGEYSVHPQDNGTIAVLASRGSEIVDGEVVDFAHEALELGEAYENLGRRVQVRTKIDFADIKHVLQDRTVSDMVLIGHGKLPFFSPFDINGNITKFTWADVAREARHLKLGRIVQRFCGIYDERWLNVPLGALAASSHSSVLATPGESFSPKDIRDPANQALRPVTDQDMLTYKEVKILFPRPVPAVAPTEIPSPLL